MYTCIQVLGQKDFLELANHVLKGDQLIVRGCDVTTVTSIISILKVSPFLCNLNVRIIVMASYNSSLQRACVRPSVRACVPVCLPALRCERAPVRCVRTSVRMTRFL